MPLEGSLDVSVDGVRVVFSLHVQNTGEGLVTLDFRSGQRADYVVFEDDTEVYRWSEGRMFTQAVGTESIEPGVSVAYRGEWSEPAPGNYTVIATLEAVGNSVETSATFEVS